MVSAPDPCDGCDLAERCNLCDLREPPSATGESGWVMGFAAKPAAPTCPGCVPQRNQALTVEHLEGQARQTDRQAAP